MDHNSEMEYIRQILDGDTRLYAYFLQKYSDPVYGMINRIIGSPEDSEELTQDVFVKAFKKLTSFSGKSRFSTWLYRIAYNMAISKTRKKRIEYPFISDSIMDAIAEDEVNRMFDGDPNEELMTKLGKLLELLPPGEKTLLTLYYNDEKPITDIAEILGLTGSNVKIRLHRIRKKLLVMLKQNSDG